MLSMPILERSLKNCTCPIGFVKMSASWCLVETWKIFNILISKRGLRTLQFLMSCSHCFNQWMNEFGCNRSDLKIMANSIHSALAKEQGRKRWSKSYSSKWHKTHTLSVTIFLLSKHNIIGRALFRISHRRIISLNGIFNLHKFFQIYWLLVLVWVLCWVPSTRSWYPLLTL